MGAKTCQDKANVGIYAFLNLKLAQIGTNYSYFRWGGYLDNSVAGGIPSGMPPFEALVKESMEEASIAEDIVRTHAKAVGSVSYYTRLVFVLSLRFQSLSN